jgi:hypothetical protein
VVQDDVSCMRVGLMKVTRHAVTYDANKNRTFSVSTWSKDTFRLRAIGSNVFWPSQTLTKLGQQ